jgi:hypothetical protein
MVYTEPKAQINLQIPISLANEINDEAYRRRMKRSDLLRLFLHEGLAASKAKRDTPKTGTWEDDLVEGEYA